MSVFAPDRSARERSTPELLDADFPADPYPGAAPDCSFVHVDGGGYRLYPDPSGYCGWRIGNADLDDWLAERGAPPLSSRVPVLAYGSNRCPSKITWMRHNLGLDGPAVLLAARTEGVSAVWAAGFRQRDGQRPAVLAAAPGSTETHAIWLATPGQVAVLDRCEGRGERYRLARLGTGRVRTEDGALVERPWTYLAAAAIRAPLLVDGAPVRCTQLDQREAARLEGTPAPDDGLDAVEVVGRPRSDEWPASLFSYGLLQPGRAGWPLVEPHLAGTPRPATVRGRVHDTGLGWPALLRDEPAGTATGTLIPINAPATLMPKLDAYEGSDYRRIRVVVPADGTVAWAYVWTGPRDILRPL